MEIAANPGGMKAQANKNMEDVRIGAAGNSWRVAPAELCRYVRFFRKSLLSMKYMQRELVGDIRTDR